MKIENDLTWFPFISPKNPLSTPEASPEFDFCVDAPAEFTGSTNGGGGGGGGGAADTFGNRPKISKINLVKLQKSDHPGYGLKVAVSRDFWHLFHETNPSGL